MPAFPSHLDLCVADPSRSIRFYAALLETLGYRRWQESDPDWQEPDPTRAAWALTYLDGSVFGIDLRPATSRLAERYDAYAPGPHHLALQAESDEQVDEVHGAMVAIGAEVADAPTEYGGQMGYGHHYYAVFFLDPDGFKVEVVHARGFNS
jgi:catechol 2,3-dioxygenase-like lactoylglutathione lyase family enzyme